MLCAAAVTLAPAPALTVMAAPAPPLTAQKPVLVPGGAGAWDWMTVDSAKRRLLATHKGTGTVALLSLTGKPTVTNLPVGAAQGIAVDTANNQYIAGDDTENKIVFVDRTTLKITGEVKVTGPVDDIELNPKNGLLYADHDDGTEVWVIDPKARKIVGTVTIGEGPEYIVYDAVTNRLYQNIKTNDTVQVIDPATNTVTATWATAPATGPHGLALDAKTGRLFAAGKNGKLAVLEIKTGKVLGSADIGPGVDQIAYDSQTKRLYCGCKGVISVLEATASGVRHIADVPQPAGAHTLAIDPVTHSVWVSYADKTNSYLQEFKASR